MKNKLIFLLTLSLLCTTPMQSLDMPKWTTVVGGAVCFVGAGYAIYLSPDSLELGLNLLKSYLTQRQPETQDTPPASPRQQTDDDSDGELEDYQPPYYFTLSPEDFTAPPSPYVMYEPMPKKEPRQE